MGEQFRRLEAAAKVAGQPVAKFLENGIGDKLQQLAGPMPGLLVLTLPDGSVWTRVEFPEPLFALLLKAARSRGMDTMEFIEQAVYEKLGAAGKAGAR